MLLIDIYVRSHLQDEQIELLSLRNAFNTSSNFLDLRISRRVLLPSKCRNVRRREILLS